MEEQQQSTPEPEPNMGTLFDELSEKFFALRQQRMTQQQGNQLFGFLSDDVVMAMMETLADIANMCDMQFIKLALLQHEIYDDLKEKGVEDGRIDIGLGAFQSSRTVWKDNQQ